MFSQFFKDRKEKKQKEEHELKLKKALAEKFSNYDSSPAKSETTTPKSDQTDYTTITLNGQKLRVAKEQITIYDIDPDRK